MTDVRGIKKVGNLYRAAGGPGWALVGDAFHQKDPLDGQGIYDALFTAKALAQAIGSWQQGHQSWEAALATYDAMVRAETFPMYRSTLERVRRDLYSPQPDWAWRSWIRWLVSDKEYQRRIGLLLVRGIHPATWMTLSVFFGAIARGAGADFVRWLARRPDPYAVRSEANQL